jgi:hypothetical protein
MEKSMQEYKVVLTEIIQKLMVLLGAGMTLTRLHDVHGLTVMEDGTVSDIQGDPAVIMQHVLDQFIELSEEIVKHITEPLVKHQSLETPVELPAAPIQPEPAPAVTMPTPTPLSVDPQPAAPATDTMPVPTTEPPATETNVAAPADKPAEISTPPTTDPFPTTQSVMPSTTADPAPIPATEQPTPTQPVQPQPTPTDPKATGKEQPDADMQHIINEALKQTK